MTSGTVEATAPADPQVQERRRDRRSVWVATLMFFGVCLGMLTMYRPFIAPDEIFQFDRVYAASHGYIVLAPEEINISSTSSKAWQTNVFNDQSRGKNFLPIDQFQPLDRGARPSMAELGGNADHDDPNARPNYMTQHPPGYYALMGVLKNQIPYAEEMPVDQLVYWLRFCNVLMALPLPLLFFAAARRLAGSGTVARAAAFLPLLIPGLARGAATINNDNLAILAGSVLLVLLIRVMQGDASRRTAILVGLAAAVGALSKITVLAMMPVVVLAYLIQWWRRRGLSPAPTMIALIVGGLVTVSWAVRSKFVYGSLQPGAMGPEFTAISNGTPRTADTPFSLSFFLDHVWQYLPGRFWGALGVLEPPSLPRWLLDALTFGVVIALVVAVLLSRGIRVELLVLWSACAMLIAFVVGKAMLHHLDYTAIPGLQGRYVYPALLGFLLPIAFALGALLRRQARFAPVMIAAAGSAIWITAFWQVIQWYWMPAGVEFGPGTVDVAFRYIGGFSPWPSVVTAGLLALVGIALLAGPVVALVHALRTPAVAPGPFLTVRRVQPAEQVPTPENGAVGAG